MHGYPDDPIRIVCGAECPSGGYIFGGSWDFQEGLLLRVNESGQITGTGIAGGQAATHSVTPSVNPVRSAAEVIIAGPAESAATVSVLDISGRVIAGVWSGTLGNSAESIMLNELPAGLYTVSAVYSDGERASCRVAVLR